MPTPERKGARSAVALPLALALGALSVLAQPPFSVPIVLPVSFGGLFLLSVRRRPIGAALVGWFFGVGFFLFGLSWIAESFLVDAERFGWMAGPAVVGLAGGLAAFPALATGLFAASRATGLAAAFAFAASWSMSEWLRGTILTGFPWNLVAYSWAEHDVPRQAAAWLGSYGLGLVTVLLAILPVAAIEAPRAGRALAALLAAAVVGGVWLGGTARLSECGQAIGTTVRIVQPNVAQVRKWDPAFRDRIVARLLELSARPGGFDVLLWPESAFPGFLEEEPSARARIAAAMPPGAVLLAGAQTRETSEDRWILRNEILAIDDDGRIVARYAKHHVVPFGEYVPWRGALPIERLTEGLGDFTPGPGPRTIALPGLPPVGPSICYEGIFPGRVADRGDRPEWLFNATNDGWFGASLGPRQHLNAARMRAVEEGLPLVRAANTGVSAVIDAEGRILRRLDLGRTGIVDAELPPARPPTPFVRHGGTIYWSFVAAFLAASVGIEARRRTIHTRRGA